MLNCSSCIMLAVAVGMSVGAVSKVFANPLYASRFSGASTSQWECASGEVSLVDGEKFGERALVVYGRKGAKDTYWGLMSPLFSLKGGTGFVLRLRYASSVDMARPEGHKGSYETCVEWADAEGVPIGECFGFGWRACTNEWSDMIVAGRIPARARSARIRLGADSPNIPEDGFVALSGISFESMNPDSDGTPCSLREDGMVLVGGRPFFPIGLYSVCKREFNSFNFDKALRDIAAAGFNTVHTYDSVRNESFREFLDGADKYGLKAFVSPRLRNRRLSGEAAGNILAERHHPCLLGWYIGDDTHWNNTPDQLLKDAETCKALDCRRLTLQADMPGPRFFGHYSDFVNCTDVMLLEMYPVWSVKPDGFEIPSIIRDMKTAMNDQRRWCGRRRSVWSIIQHFQGWKRKRFPTFDELRAMTYLSIIHGAKGVTWYTYGGSDKKETYGVTHTPATWSQICRMAKELSTIHDDLASFDAVGGPVAGEVTTGPKTDTMRFPSVSCLLKEGVGGKILLAANSSNAEVHAKICVPAGPTGRAEVLFENRLLNVDRNLEDDFGPYAVHVYRLK